MPIRRATSLFLIAVAFVAGGCGESANQKQKKSLARSNCIDAAMRRAEVSAVAAAYDDGRLGSPATVQRQVAKLPPLLGVSKTSFLDAKGNVVPWSRMTNAQQRTFLAWEYQTPSVSNVVGADVDAALARAKDQARSTCQHVS